jgi:hypothetical protein
MATLKLLGRSKNFRLLPIAIAANAKTPNTPDSGVSRGALSSGVLFFSFYKSLCEATN